MPLVLIEHKLTSIEKSMATTTDIWLIIMVSMIGMTTIAVFALWLAL